MRRTVFVLAVVLFAALAAGAAPASGALRLVTVASGFDAPVHLAATPSERGRLYVVEQRGVVKVVARGRVRSRPFLDVRDRVSCCGEQGLLSLVFHPRYGRNGRLYVNFTNRAGDTRVVEYRVNAARTRVREGTARVVLRVDQPYSNHNGGGMTFGPGGYLYVAMGDGGSAGDPGNRAQDPNTRLGKLLRLNVNRRGARPTIVGVGLRNPWRFAFDRGNLYIADVGQSAREEIDFVPRGSAGRENYGWRRYEGSRLYDADTALYRPSRLVWPIHEYGRAAGCSVTGGFVYRGRIAAARGRYFFGDYCTGAVWSFRVVSGRKRGLRREPFTVPTLSSFGRGSLGGMYLLSHTRGIVFRLASR